MKRVILVGTAVLLAMAILSVGCAKTTPTPAPAATTHNVTGTLKDLNTPTEPGKDVVSIQTPQGTQNFTITANTTYSLEGRTCLLADVNKVVDEGNVTYECTVVLTGLTPYGDDQAALAIYVKKK